MDEFADRMAALRARFRQRLAGDVRTMDDLMDRTPTLSDLAEVQSTAHKLAGLAGSMGMPEVSDMAKALDREWSCAPDDLAEVRRLMALLRASAAD